MSARRSFDLATTPLGEGFCLIEASAGTGKTFTIAGLYLRLILERDVPVREILVVTFTEAATEELRGRIRKTLADAAAALAAGRTSDKALAEMLKQHWADAALLANRLQRALTLFDEAAIHTIHGFCQRTLRDRAFESSSLFDLELLTDDREMLLEVADDWWRERFYNAPALLVATALRKKPNPEALLPLLKNHSRHPELRILSRAGNRTLKELQDALLVAFESARDAWQTNRAKLQAIFDAKDTWAKGEHAKDEVAQRWFTALDAGFSETGPDGDTLKALENLTPDALEENTHQRKKTAVTPRNKFFDCAASVVSAAGDFLAGLSVDFLDFARRELPRRKERNKVQSFDDLLTRLRNALAAPGGDALARAIRERYRAALIDEFQDTDPVQSDIFRFIFLSGQATETEARNVFLVGDPKQAIYGFRGADVFSYLDARRHAAREFSLDRNWRSEAGLVRAVNTIFGARPNPFAVAEIEFTPVIPAGHADDEPLTEDGLRLPPLRCCFMEREAGRSLSKEAAREMLPDRVATEIVRLLNGDVKLGQRIISPRDIAVLIRTNEEAGWMQEALRRRGVPSVLHTDRSVFSSTEARELQLLLEALAQPGRDRLLRPALATSLMGSDGNRLDDLGRDELAWQEQVEKFRAWHDEWSDHGFAAMFRAWLQDAEIRQRLLTFTDGERRLTNVLHLGELLHQASEQSRLGMNGLLRWFADQIAAPDNAADEQQLRLERDDEAIRLVTIHKSKGLEYAVVFCPFSWYSFGDPKNPKSVSFHERDPAGRVTARMALDLGSEEMAHHLEFASEEKLAEELRLLYVALTRAQHRCYFVWGAMNGAESSAPAWLLHRPASLNTPSREALSAHFEMLTDDALRCDLEALVNASCEGDTPTIEIAPLPAENNDRFRPRHSSPVDLQARQFTGHILLDWRIASFSSLVANAPDEEPDHDRATMAPVGVELDDAPASDIFAFPRGTQAGTCLHKIFENADFTRTDDDRAMEKLASEILFNHGMDAEKFGPTVVATVRRTMVVPLEPAAFTLSRVPLKARVNELEFCFPVRELSPALLRAGFAGSHAELAERMGRLGFAPSGGYVKGFIDLVVQFDGRFYILDWKSNWLGNRVENYDRPALARAMTESFYTLQYHLYVVALHRYLALRVPGYDYARHFGGVRYVFLRGLDPARPELGVFADRPDATLIESLSAAWAGGGGTGHE
jgi:exodeoxyribonuclease V beta subunit